MRTLVESQVGQKAEIKPNKAPWDPPDISQPLQPAYFNLNVLSPKEKVGEIRARAIERKINRQAFLDATPEELMRKRIPQSGDIFIAPAYVQNRTSSLEETPGNISF